MVSISWASEMFRADRVLAIRANKAMPIRVRIKIRIVMALS